MAAVLPPHIPVANERDRAIAGLGSMSEEPPPIEGDDFLDAGHEFQVEETADGSAVVDLAEEDRPAAPREYRHKENLAEVLPETELGTLALLLVRKVEYDKKSREERDKQYAEGIEKAGLGAEKQGASFIGASKVVHPMIAEACVDFASSAMKELFPPNGPVKTKIKGDATKEKLKLAERQAAGLNWQLTESMVEYAEELEQLLTQLPLGGSQFLKFYFSMALGRVTAEFIPIDDYLLPYAAASLMSAERRTHVQRLTDLEFEDRVRSKFYRDLSIVAPSTVPDETKAGEAAARVEGKSAEGMNEDGLRLVYEVDCLEALSVDRQGKDDNRPYPYLISIDEQSGKIVSIYRNWSERDPLRKRLDWVVEFGFIPWRGAYKIGLIQLIGSLSIAATGALRALLDSAHVNNAPTAFMLKGSRTSGQSKDIAIGTINEIDGGVGVKDIRELLSAAPFNPPSTVLFQLLGWLTEAAKGVVTTAEEKIAEAGNNMPVGTALALIEQGSKVASAIHARLHRAQQTALRIIARIDAEYSQLFEQLQQSEVGEVLCTGAELATGLAVSPVSDPNVFSEGQRYAQNQMLLQLAAMGAQTGVNYNMYAVHRRILETAKIPAIEEVLPEPQGPKELNAAVENMQALMGAGLMAFPSQDHLAHLETHLRFAKDPYMGGSRTAQPVFVPRIVEHIKQHVGFYYAEQIYSLTSDAIQGDVSQLLQQQQQGGDQGKKIDQLIAAASRLAHATADKHLSALGPIFDELTNVIVALQPAAPKDPTDAAFAETQRRAARDAEELRLREEKDRKGEALEARGQDVKLVDTILRHEDAAAERERPGNQVPGV